MGDLPDADAVAEVENPACGDRTRLAIQVRDSRITAARFRTEGCPAAIAASSMMTELIVGRTLEEAAALRDEDVAEALGGLPRNKLHCSVLAEDVIQAVVEQYRSRFEGPDHTGVAFTTEEGARAIGTGGLGR